MTRPRLVYDDDCGFCTWCARIGRRYADIEPVGFSELSPATIERLPREWRSSAHLLSDAGVASGGAAVEATLARTHPALRALTVVAAVVPGYPAFRERLYRWVADRRGLWGRLVSADDA